MMYFFLMFNENSRGISVILCVLQYIYNFVTYFNKTLVEFQMNYWKKKFRIIISLVFS